MRFFELAEAGVPVAQQAELMLRIVVASFCGMCIGVERGRRSKDAGIRTHCMVACTAAVMTVISKYGFIDMLSTANGPIAQALRADPARIAAQVVSGISFLGVGVIYRDRRNATKGLTTAAGIWAVAGIGMAIGAGMYLIGLFTTVFVLALQIVMHKPFFLRDRLTVNQRLVVNARDEDGKALDRLNARLEQWKVTVLESQIDRTDAGMLHCKYLVRMNAEQGNQPVTRAIMEDAGVTSVDWGAPDEPGL